MLLLGAEINSEIDGAAAEIRLASGISGSPIIPVDAIQMADWAISHGLLGDQNDRLGHSQRAWPALDLLAY
jgi:hypothetical protein